MTDSLRIRWQHRLKQQAQQIEETLKHWQLPGHITGGSIDHPWTVFEFDRPPFPILGQLDTTALCHDLQHDLGVPVVEWQQRNNGLVLAVQQPQVYVPLLTALEDFPASALYEAYLGQTDRHTNLYWQLTDPQSRHIVATGAPGAGLTDLLLAQGMALALTHTPQQVRFLLLDGSTSEPSPLQPLAQLPHTIKLATSDRADDEPGQTAGQLLAALARHCLAAQAHTPAPPINNLPPRPTQATANRPPLTGSPATGSAAGPTANPLARPTTNPFTHPITNPLTHPTTNPFNGPTTDHTASPNNKPATTLPARSASTPANGNGQTATLTRPPAQNPTTRHPVFAASTNQPPTHPYANGSGHNSHNGHATAASAPPRLVVICHRLDLLLARQPHLVHALSILLGDHQLPINLLATVRPPAFARCPALAQFPLRLVGCVPDPATAAHLTGRPHSQAERLLGGGDFLAIADALFVHVQAASIDRYDFDYCLTKLLEAAASPTPTPITHRPTTEWPGAGRRY
jgi:hypothetical protein